MAREVAEATRATVEAAQKCLGEAVDSLNDVLIKESWNSIYLSYWMCSVDACQLG